MKLIERYVGPFTREQVDELGIMLGFNHHSTSQYIAARINGALILCSMQEKARKNVSNTKAAVRRLDRITTSATRLARDLEEEPLAENLVRPPGGFLDRAGPDGGINMSELRAEDRERCRHLIELLRQVASEAYELSTNDTSLRALHFLPTTSEAGRSTLALLLWPEFFNLWAEVGRAPAQTAYGPLHRFVAFVHDAVEAPKPSPGTLRDAVIQWKQDGGMARIARRSAYQNDGED